MAEQGHTTKLQSILDRWGAGDESALDELIVHAQERLRRMARAMLSHWSRVKRWNQTDDVLQNALVRLHRALKDVKPESKKAFYGLAATQIRRELNDMAKSLYGEHGLGKNHQSDPAQANPDGNARPRHEGEAPVTDHADLELMTQFHEKVGELPGDEREVFECMYYYGMKRAEVAEHLGVAERTITRRWRKARQLLQESLGLSF